LLDYFLQQLSFALAIGAIYGLIALGYTMVYGVMRLINFAHGELFMLGPYVYAFLLAGLFGFGFPGLDSVLAIVGCFMVVGLLGIVIERFAYRPLRAYGRLAPMLSALGISIVLQSAVRVTIGPQPMHFPAIIESRPIAAFNGMLTTVQLGILLAAVLLMVCLTLFVNQTRFGIWIRAASESWETSKLLGIRVNRAVSLVFFIGPGLGAMAGILYASYYGIMQPGMGSVVGLKAFTAAILGGIGSIPGAMLGGLLLGIVETFGTAFLPILTNNHVGTEYRDVFAFAVLILVLLIKPSGLLGETASEETAVVKKDY